MRRPDDPGAQEHRDDLFEARAILGWPLLVLAIAGIAAVYLLT